MADKVREQRAEARERRRSLTAKPFEELDDGAANGSESTVTPLAAAKGVAATAAAAAIAGAIAGAAKALRERGQEETSEEPHNEEAPDEATADEPTGDQPDAEPEEDEEDEQQPVPPAAEAEADDDQPADEDDEPAEPAATDEEQQEQEEQEEQEEEPADDDERDGASGRSPGDAMQVVAQAREHLKNLLGADAESISGIERSNGNWEVKLEVVEMRRIPESTDILSSYTAVLDDDGGIVSLTRGRRYRRSQVEEG